MRSLHTDDLDIVGFGGIREQILVMAPSQFSGRVVDGAWQGFGDLTYLAHAYFKRYGETGLHYHDNVDIISVITRGEIHHQGTLGDGDVIKAGQVLVQCAGPKSFRHNEINPSSDIYGMVQIWMRPSDSTKLSQQHQIITLNSEGETPIYGEGTSFKSPTTLSILDLLDGQEIKSDQSSLLYLYDGTASIKESENDWVSITRGQLIQCVNFTLKGKGKAIWIRLSDS